MTLVYFGSVVDPTGHLHRLPVAVVNEDAGGAPQAAAEHREGRACAERVAVAEEHLRALVDHAGLVVDVMVINGRRPSESILELRAFATVSAPGETRRRLRPWLATHSFNAQAVGDVLVAVSEAVANSVEHSGVSPNDQVTVRARLGSGRLDVTVRDTGRWRRTRRDPLRGFGLKLMQSLMDTITIDQRDDGTRIDMTLTPTAGAF